MLYNKNFLDELFLNRDRETYIRIDLLTWDEVKIKEIQGTVISGSLTVDGNSIIRRSVNFEMILDPNRYFLPEIAEEISISRKVAVFIGLKNNTKFGRFPEIVTSAQAFLTSPIIWFNLGSFVPTQVSLSHEVENSSISITAQDKMVLLNGDISGELGYDIEFVKTLTNENLPYIDVIKDSVSFFGGIDSSKIIISDVPYYGESLTRVKSDPMTGLYAVNISGLGKRTFDINSAAAYTTGSILSPTIQVGDILPIQLTLSPKNKETRIEVSSTNRVTDILDQVASGLLGQYEYFFDIDGNFIFQSKKFLEDVQEIDLFQNDNSQKYFTKFDSISYIYDFNDKELISSFSNSPDWRGIKNEFYIYGAKNLLYHLAIDRIPKVPSFFYSKIEGIWTGNLEPYNQPWQQYIIDLTEYNAQVNPDISESRYYSELKKFFEFDSENNSGIYKKLSPTTGVWRSDNTGQENDDFDFSLRPNGDPFTWNYFFDIIDDNDPILGKFSINSMGRRIKSIRDDNITIIYPRKLEPTYVDSFNREIKIILYEDLENEPVGIYSLQVSGGSNVTAVSETPQTLTTGDSIIISNMPSSIGTALNGTWSINTVSSDLKTFGFTTSGTSSNGKSYINFNRSLHSTASVGATSLTLLSGSESIKTGLRVVGLGLAANTTVTSVNTSINTVSIGLSLPLISTSSANNTMIFSVGSFNVAKFGEFKSKNESTFEIEKQLENSEVPYVSMLKSQLEPHIDSEEFQYKGDAFSSMKNLLYIHTNFNETVSVSAIPLYFLEPNNKINLTDINTGVFGDHFLQSFNIPLSPDGVMTLEAIKIQK
jgi:hypothetical protein